MKKESNNLEQDKSLTCEDAVVPKRNFIVFYIGNTPNGRVTGYMDFTSYDGSYLNKTLTLKQLDENSIKIEDIVFTNIIELNDNDFNDWIHKD